MQIMKGNWFILLEDVISEKEKSLDIQTQCTFSGVLISALTSPFLTLVLFRYFSFTIPTV